MAAWTASVLRISRKLGRFLKETSKKTGGVECFKNLLHCERNPKNVYAEWEAQSLAEENLVLLRPPALPSSTVVVSWWGRHISGAGDMDLVGNSPFLSLSVGIEP